MPQILLELRKITHIVYRQNLRNVRNIKNLLEHWRHVSRMIAIHITHKETPRFVALSQNISLSQNTQNKTTILLCPLLRTLVLYKQPKQSREWCRQTLTSQLNSNIWACNSHFCVVCERPFPLVSESAFDLWLALSCVWQWFLVGVRISLLVDLFRNNVHNKQSFKW